MVYKKQNAKNISFPLGGIGTGCIGLAGNGQLIDWEIFNHPQKNTLNGYSHFAIKATCNGKSTARVLQGDGNENLIGISCASRSYYGFGHGPRINSLAGFPHFEDVAFDGSFPIADLTFKDSNFPATVRLRAFNPFIPHDYLNSSLPVAFFEWEIENTSNETVEYALAGTVWNPASSTANEKISSDNLNGIFLKNAEKSDTDVDYSDLCILTDNEETVAQEYWYRGPWRDNCTTYWKNLLELDRMPQRHYDTPARGDHGTLTSYVSIPAGEKAKLRFVIAWNVPVMCNTWSRRPEGAEAPATWRNYYATEFKSSFESAKYAIEHFSALHDKTARFSDALQSCTLPDAVKDAISANLSVIKTPTALRLEDGSFWGWEGCHELAGSCAGTCQHVWNYAYVMPYLFPRLERSIREITLKYALQDSGATSFRVSLPLKREMCTARACVDGQMGEVFKCYREWKFSGDDQWLKEHSEGIFKMLEYAWSEENPDKWDADCDGVLEGRQHHTLDMELFGPSSWLQGLYLLALDCGIQMAKHLNDEERAEKYTRLYEQGKSWMNSNLFNGKYFMQKIDLTDKSMLEPYANASNTYWNDEAGEIKYQAADGCCIDQMLADWHAVLIGANSVFDADKKKTALRNLYKNNFRESMNDFTNLWRIYALKDEGGTLLCTYPEGVKTPAIPLPYCDEAWTGLEYAVAGLMISEGFVKEGEQIVEKVRERYNGENRNPWSEIECGSNYARSMASYALMPIYSGFTFDMTQKHIGFAPVSDSGKYLFSVCESWGTVEFDNEGCCISVLGDPLTLSSVSLPGHKDITCITVDGKKIDFTVTDKEILLGKVEISGEMRLK